MWIQALCKRHLYVLSLAFDKAHFCAFSIIIPLNYNATTKEYNKNIVKICI